VSSTAAAGADPFAGHSPDQGRPLVGYATLTAVFLGACGAFSVWLRRAGIELPERIDGRDVALVSVATHKLSRLITRDRVTSTVRAPFTRFQDDAGPSEVDEAARGRGLRRAIGELMICPYCLDLWISAGFVGGLIARPRATRSIASVFTVLAAADGLQIAYKKAEDTL
jgi:Protein of unknown function (DUF1360)